MEVDWRESGEGLGRCRVFKLIYSMEGKERLGRIYLIDKIF